MRHGRSHGSRASRRLVAVLAGALVATLALAAALSTGAAHAQTQSAPTNTALPTISGNAAVGQTLTASKGTWSGTGTITYAYQWLRCDSNGAHCDAIAGSTSSKRSLSSSDAGHRLRVAVKATNADGSASVNSAATPVVAAGSSGPPVNTQEPSISGSAVQGQTLSANKGSWSGANPITYKYQWLRCDANAANCSAITGETSPNHTLLSGDVGHRLRVRVTASNTSGTASVNSNGSGVVSATGGSGPPVNTALPMISGSPVEGTALVATDGTWTGAATISFTYQWLRCDANGDSCSSITGETTHNRTLTGDDVGHRLRIRVTGKNGVGSASVQSDPSAAVTSSSGPTGPLPDGAVKLPSGKYSIPVTSVSLPTQLVIDKVKFAPNPIRSRIDPIVVRVHILDTRGYVVRDALVFIRSVPAVTTTPLELPTGQDGWTTFQVLAKPDFPLKNRGFVQFFARVRKAGDNILVGVGSRRLVQVRTAR
jgi:hypothetical protein